MNPAKTILKAYGWQIAGAVILIIAIVILIKKMSSGIGDFFSDPNKSELQKALEKDVSAVSVKSANLSFPDSYYTGWANKMYDAMWSWIPYFMNRFTEEQFQELEALTADDLKKIFKAFGVKEKANWGGLWKQLEGTLFDWFESDLANTELARMKAIFKKTGLW
jgi:hypothetical protein